MLNLQALRQVIKLSERVANNTTIRKEIMRDIKASSQLSLMIKMSSSIALNEDNYIPLQISAACFVDALDAAIAEDQAEMKQIEKEIREEC